jgi:RNA polymerase-binding transcription factor DksA
MSYNDEFINELKLKLLKEKDEILALVERSKTYELDSDGDEIDEIQAKLIYNVDSKLAAKKIENLNKINSALLKIKTRKIRRMRRV